MIKPPDVGPEPVSGLLPEREEEKLNAVISAVASKFVFTHFAICVSSARVLHVLRVCNLCVLSENDPAMRHCKLPPDHDPSEDDLRRLMEAFKTNSTVVRLKLGYGCNLAWIGSPDSAPIGNVLYTHRALRRLNLSGCSIDGTHILTHKRTRSLTHARTHADTGLRWLSGLLANNQNVVELILFRCESRSYFLTNPTLLMPGLKKNRGLTDLNLVRLCFLCLLCFALILCVLGFAVVR